jgi:hypothetical protein
MCLSGCGSGGPRLEQQQPQRPCSSAAKLRPLPSLPRWALPLLLVLLLLLLVVVLLLLWHSSS